MSNSTTLLDTISASQAAKEATANAMLDAASPAMIFGRRASTCSALTWGFYGGRMLVDGVLTAIANGTVALTASTTNYVEATRAGVVSKNTTGFTAGQIPLYTIVTGTATVTSYTDERTWVAPYYISQEVAITVTTADVTLSAAQARGEYISASGTLTGNRNVIVPDRGEWEVYNGCAGAFTLTVKTSGGSGVVIAAGDRALLRADGTNVVTIATSSGAYTLPTASAGTLGGIKVGSGLSIDGAGVLSASASAPDTQSITDFDNDTGTTTGLTYGYMAGVIRSGTTVTAVTAGTIALTASVTNYIEVDGSGTVSVNSSAFTSGRYPMATAVTDGSGITNLTDKRGLISVSAGSSGTAGRQAIPVMAGSMSPSVTGGCASLARIASGANQPDIVTLDFDATTQEYAQFSVVMPKKWNEGTVTFVPHWSHAATTTNFGVVWDLQAVAVSNDDAIAVAFGTAQTSTDTGGTTNDFYTGPESSAITVAGTPAAEDCVFFRLSRVTGNGSDTMAIDARLHGITLYITTDAETDA